MSTPQPTLLVSPTAHTAGRPSSLARLPASWTSMGLILGAMLLWPLLSLVSPSQPTLALLQAVVQGGLGLALLFLAPGYALMLACFPDPTEHDTPARLALSIGSSVMIIPLLALLLDQLPWGIHPWPILVSEYALMLLCLLVAAWRQTHLDLVAPPPQGPRLRGGVMFAQVLVVVGVILTLALVGLTQPPPDSQLTEFYLLGRRGLVGDYPRQSSPGAPVTATIGIVNQEGHPHHYHIEVWVSPDPAMGQPTLATRSEPIVLAPGQRAEGPLTWQMVQPGADQLVDFWLYRDDYPEPYRQLQLRLDVVP